MSETTTPILFTTPSDRPSLAREVLAALHESKAPLDVDGLHDEVNSDGKAHVAKGPLDVLLAELVRAGKIAEVAHGQPARPHFVLVAEVREEFDGTWTRAKALAAVIVAMGDPTNSVSIQDITGTLGEALMRVDGALPIPLPLLSAVASTVDVNSPEAVDAMVAVQLDALVRSGIVVMLPNEPPATEVGDSASSDETTTPSDSAEPPTPVAPNLHASMFTLSVLGWETLLEKGALATAVIAIPELQQKTTVSANEVREMKRRVDELQREFDIHKEVSARQIASLETDNKKLRTEHARFVAFCEDKGIDFALAANNASNERVRERHTIKATLTIETLTELIGERTKAHRYAEALEERVKDQTTSGKAAVKEAKTRVEQLDNIVAMAESGIGSDFSMEKMCIKYVQGGALVWKSDEPHDQGRTVEVKLITGDVEVKEEGKEGEKKKPTQLAIPGTAKAGELEWQPGDPPPVGSGEGEAAVVPADVSAVDSATPTDEPAIAVDDVGEDEDEEVDGDDDGEELTEEEEDEEEEGKDEDEEPTPNSSTPVIAGKPAVDSVSAKAFIRERLKKGRTAINDVGKAYAESIGHGDKDRVVKFGVDIATQLIQAQELESEKVGDSQFVWLKAEAESGAKPTRVTRTKKTK